MKDEAFWLLVGKASAGLASAAFLVASFYYSNSATRIRQAKKKYGINLSRLSHAPVMGRLGIALVMLLFPYAIASGLIARDKLAAATGVVSLVATSIWAVRYVWISPPGNRKGRVAGIVVTSVILGSLAALALMFGWSGELGQWQSSVLKGLAILAPLAGLIWILLGVEYAARHYAVFPPSDTDVDRLEQAKESIEALWRQAGESYADISRQRAALARQLGQAVFEWRLRHAASDRRALQRRVDVVSAFPTDQRFFSLYEVQEFFDEVKRLEKDLTDWTDAILGHIQAARQGSAEEGSTSASGPSETQ